MPTCLVLFLAIGVLARPTDVPLHPWFGSIGQRDHTEIAHWTDRREP